VTRSEGTHNAKLGTGDVEIKASEILILNDANVPPFQLEVAGSENLADEEKSPSVAASIGNEPVVSVEHDRNADSPDNFFSDREEDCSYYGDYSKLRLSLHNGPANCLANPGYSDTEEPGRVQTREQDENNQMVINAGQNEISRKLEDSLIQDRDEVMMAIAQALDGAGMLDPGMDAKAVAGDKTLADTSAINEAVDSSGDVDKIMQIIGGKMQTEGPVVSNFDSPTNEPVGQVHKGAERPSVEVSTHPADVESPEILMRGSEGTRAD